MLGKIARALLLAGNFACVITFMSFLGVLTYGISGLIRGHGTWMYGPEMLFLLYGLIYGTALSSILTALVLIVATAGNLGARAHTFPEFSMDRDFAIWPRTRSGKRRFFWFMALLSLVVIGVGSFSEFVRSHPEMLLTFIAALAGYLWMLWMVSRSEDQRS